MGVVANLGIVGIYCLIGLLMTASIVRMWRRGKPYRDMYNQKHDNPETSYRKEFDSATIRMKFEAVSDCPNCGHIDVHPFTALYEEVYRTVQLDPSDPTLVQMGPGRYGRMIEPGLVRPILPNVERVLSGEVVRQCTRCAHEWRQR